MTNQPENSSRAGAERVREALGLDGSGRADPERLAEALVMAVAALGAIDQVTTGAWGQMAPGSGERERSGITDRLGAFLASGAEADRAALQKELDEARLLAVCLLAATPRAGQVSWRHVARLAPERLEGVAKAEKKWNESLEFACWRKYRELAGEMDAAGFEDEVMTAIGSYVRTLLDKRRRSESGGDEG